MGFCVHGIPDGDDLHTDSNALSNIQVNIFTCGNINNWVPDSCSTMPVNRSHGYLTPYSSVPGETLLSTSTICSSSLADHGFGALPARSTGPAEISIISRKKSVDCHSRQNHQNLVPRKRTQSHRSALCKRSITIGNRELKQPRRRTEDDHRK